MPNRIARLSVCAVLLALGCSVPLSAQSAPDARPAADADSMAAALKLRGSIAQAVAAGTTKPEDALGQLREESSPTGLKLDPDADFAFAAIDVGHRLLAAGKTVQAEKVFQAAEQSLDTVVKRTANAQAREKAQYLTQLSLIRGNYLNKKDQARQDIDEAIGLQPEDKDLKRAKDALGVPAAEFLQRNAPKKG